MCNRYFENKVVIITGSSSGIGKAIALRLSEQSASVVIAARNQDELRLVAAECAKHEGKAVAVPTDVSEEASCRHLIERTVAEFGGIDMLVNNAGIDVLAKLEDLPDLHLFKRVMDVNFYGSLYCTYYALPYLKKSKGRIVNISSMGGIIAIPLNTSYVASKFALNGFSESLRMELLDTGVSVSVICPYWVVTKFHENYMDKNGRQKGPAGRAIYTDRMMSADRCAQAVIRAARLRKRELLLGPGKLGALLRLIAPVATEKVIINTILRPISKRMEKAEISSGA